MAVWLWVDGLASGQMNDWMPASEFSSHGWSGGVFSITVAPGRLNPHLVKWLTGGASRQVSVFFDPQTEYTFTDGLLTGYSTVGSSGRVSLGINYRKVSISYSGEP